MALRSGLPGKRALLPLGCILMAILTASAQSKVRRWFYPEVSAASAAPAEPERGAQRLKPDTLRLSPETMTALAVQTTPACRPTRPRTLELTGSLGIDTNRLARVHTRFAGEVVEIGMQTIRDADGQTAYRPLDLGDRVHPGQLLAVIWSKDLGEKKSELVDALSRLRLDQATLERMQEHRAALPERSIQEAAQKVEADQISVERARRTLRSWRLTDAEIRQVEQEAERLRTRPGRSTADLDPDWARVEVRAPFAGTLLERNVAPGDIVDPSADLFKIADLSQLRVWAHAYEEDLPLLHALPQPIRWKVRLAADASAEPFAGAVERIGDLVDPNDHTARVLGRVDNSDGRLHAGQFITASIELPPPAAEVEVPTAALIEDGRSSVVFVQPDPALAEFTRRAVQVTRRQRDVVSVRGSLRLGERVVTSGALELNASLDDQ